MWVLLDAGNLQAMEKGHFYAILAQLLRRKSKHVGGPSEAHIHNPPARHACNASTSYLASAVNADARPGLDITCTFRRA
jgi:hypothetical protein